MFGEYEDDLELEEWRRDQNEKEIRIWKDFFSNFQLPPKIRSIIDDAISLYEEQRMYEGDDIIIDNFRILNQNDIITHFLEIFFVKNVFTVAYRHPMHDRIKRELVLSKARKPSVGAMIERYISMISRSDGTYEAFPAKHSTEKSVRVVLNGSVWNAVSIQNPGIVTFIEGEIPVDWSHLEITHVGFRSCKAVARSIDINQLIKEGVIQFQKDIGRNYKKIKVEVNW